MPAWLLCTHAPSSGEWDCFPPSWGDAPEERVLACETLTHVRQAIEALPPTQRTVVELRDAQGWTADEVRDVLQISDLDQRALPHRDRSRVRRSLVRHVTGV
jgi:RNA polymerase sigma-70 factor, ECF subfamily